MAVVQLRAEPNSAFDSYKMLSERMKMGYYTVFSDTGEYPVPTV